MMEKADLSKVFARSFIANAGAIAVAALVYTVLAFTIFRPLRRSGRWACCCPATPTRGTWASGGRVRARRRHVDRAGPPRAGRLPPAAALAHLDYRRSLENGGKVPVARLVTLPIRNPLTVGCLIGLALNLAHISLPGLLETPLEMLGGVASHDAPGVRHLVAARPKAEARCGECRVVRHQRHQGRHPAAERFSARQVRAAPSRAQRPRRDGDRRAAAAQNIYVFGMRYGVRELFARDTIFRTTIVSAVVILLLAALL